MRIIIDSWHLPRSPRLFDLEDDGVVEDIAEFVGPKLGFNFRPTGAPELTVEGIQNWLDMWAGAHFTRKIVEKAAREKGTFEGGQGDAQTYKDSDDSVLQAYEAKSYSSPSEAWRHLFGSDEDPRYSLYGYDHLDLEKVVDGLLGNMPISLVELLLDEDKVRKQLIEYLSEVLNEQSREQPNVHN